MDGCFFLHMNESTGGEGGSSLNRSLVFCLIVQILLFFFLLPSLYKESYTHNERWGQYVSLVFMEKVEIQFEEKHNRGRALEDKETKKQVTGVPTRCTHLSFPWERKAKQKDTYFRMCFSYSQHRTGCYWSASCRIWGLVQ